MVSLLFAGSVYWYFVLLNYVKDEDLAGCSTACAALLTAVSRQLQDRLTPLEALLQTRYVSILECEHWTQNCSLLGLPKTLFYLKKVFSLC